MGPEKAKRKHGLETAQWNNGSLVGIKRYTVQYGPVSPGPLMGQELQSASYGPKVVMGNTWAGSYNRLESYWMAQMKLPGLIRIGRNGS